MSSKSAIVIAIDGPSASGKSTVARMAAVKLGFNYVDSGSFYRGITWKALREGIETTDSQQVVALINRIDFQCFLRDGAVQFAIDGEEPGDQIRSQPVQEHVSDIAAVPEVRTFLVNMLRETARLGSLAMEGRDIGTVVFPEAEIKIFLDAAAEVRARRRLEELQAKGQSGLTLEAVLKDINERDTRDRTRGEAPLMQAPDAEYVDSTENSIEQVEERILALVRARTSNGKELHK